MPVAIDTSVLIHAEKAGDFEHLLPDNLKRRFCICTGTSVA